MNPKSIGQPTGIHRHLRAVSVTVEHRENANKRHRCCDRQIPLQRYGQAEDHYGECDPQFNEWNVNAGDP